jgi:hypothetical protein
VPRAAADDRKEANLIVQALVVSDVTSPSLDASAKRRSSQPLHPRVARLRHIQRCSNRPIEYGKSLDGARAVVQGAAHPFDQVCAATCRHRLGAPSRSTCPTANTAPRSSSNRRLVPESAFTASSSSSISVTNEPTILLKGQNDRLGRPQLPPPFTSINLNAVFFVFSGRNQAWPQVSPRRGHRTFGGTFYEASGTSAQQPRQPCPAPPVAKKAQDWKIPVHPPFSACNILKRMFEFERYLEGRQCRRICHCLVAFSEPRR